MEKNGRLQSEIARRRTFAIISHPDAGKTTLTEKLLLYGGAIELAGSVTAKKKQKETSSDWMELEKKRGISISSTVLQFEYRGFKLNLLDTPGHKDFSEDTYRVLMAVDAVIMVIDGGKGIESQTLKLFEICSKRGIPIFTFINKLDRPALPPLELLDQIEKMLHLHTYPINWPLDSGASFRGLYDIYQKSVHSFEKVPGGAYRAPVSVHGMDDPSVRENLTDNTWAQIKEELELIEIAHSGFSMEDLLAGKATPVFFGSAANNFGIEMFLNWFLDHSTGPSPRRVDGKEIPLDHSGFSGFVFKIQTNMNPQHRDRMVFVRICSGKFTRDMPAYNQRSEREVRISNSHNVFGRERETMDEGYAGDIIGFITNADFRIGDTLTEDKAILYNEIPRFAPEVFAYLLGNSVSGQKAYRKGLSHLLAEDIVQGFYPKDDMRNVPLLGAVGPLQFEVLQYRLKDEYGVETTLEQKQWTILRWLEKMPDEEMQKLYLPHGVHPGKDDQERPVLFFLNKSSLYYFQEKNEGVVLLDSP